MGYFSLPKAKQEIEENLKYGDLDYVLMNLLDNQRRLSKKYIQDTISEVLKRISDEDTPYPIHDLELWCKPYWLRGIKELALKEDAIYITLKYGNL